MSRTRADCRNEWGVSSEALHSESQQQQESSSSIMKRSGYDGTPQIGDKVDWLDEVMTISRIYGKGYINLLRADGTRSGCGNHVSNLRWNAKTGMWFDWYNR